MLDLQEMRKEIDVIDDQIVKLFEKRMSIAEHVAKFKIENNKPVFDRNREEEKLEALGIRPTVPLTAAGYRSCISTSCLSAGSVSISFYRNMNRQIQGNFRWLTPFGKKT